MRRSASSAENPHIPRPPRPPAVLTAAASAGVLSQPIGAWRMGHLRLSLWEKRFLAHIDCPSDDAIDGLSDNRGQRAANAARHHRITSYLSPANKNERSKGQAAR